MRLIYFHKQQWSFRSVLMRPGCLLFTFYIYLVFACFYLSQHFYLLQLLIDFLRLPPFIIFIIDYLPIDSFQKNATLCIGYEVVVVTVSCSVFYSPDKLNKGKM